MAKVVIDARTSGTSTGRYADKLIEYLHKLKPEFDVVVLTQTERLDFFKRIAPSFETARCDIGAFGLSEQLKLRRQIKKLKPDLVHFTMANQPVLYKANKLTTIHDLTALRFENPTWSRPVFKLKQLVYRFVIKSAAKNSRAVITPSQFVKQDIARLTGVPAGKIAVTYEAADRIDDKPEPLPRLKGKRFIMYVGRATPHKNLGRLVSAFELLTQKYPDLNLVLAGKSDASYKKIGQLVTRRRLAHSIVFPDHVSEGELRWLYENTAAYVFPSLSEGFGLPPLEAMIHGAPVISSNSSCLPEINGEGAIYFDPLNVKEMASQIDKVLSDPRLRSQLESRGRSQAAKYSWKRLAEQTYKIYQAALK